MLKVENISFSYTDEPFIKGLSFEIGEGEFVSILGSNGSGKSTLFSIISGAVKPRGGTVEYNGKDLHGLSAKERAR
jgi:branched-chain amino acid transport system ATP-binding protein